MFAKDKPEPETTAAEEAQDETRDAPETAAETEAVSEEPPEETLTGEEKLRAELAEAGDKLLRAMADFDNYKKRVRRQHEELLRAANDELLLEFLEIVDNFERALKHVNDSTDLKTLRRGTQLIFNQVSDLLARHEVRPIEAVGREFDPNLHEAVVQVETDEFDEGRVAVELARGYRRGERVLRYSKVGVSRPGLTDEDGEAPEEPSGEEEGT